MRSRLVHRLLAAVGVLAGAVSPAGGQAAAVLSPDTVSVRSSVLGQDRTVFVSLPESHARTSREYPVIVVLDGEWRFADASFLAARLARLGHVPEAIVVGVANVSRSPQDRLRDLTPPGLSVSGSSLNEGGDRFLDFLERELLPLVRERWRGGGMAVLVGHSSGGVLATWAAATRPRLFGAVVSIDAPIHLGDAWLAQRLVERARADAPGSLRYVSLDATYGWPDDAWRTLESGAPDGWRLHRERIEGETHESMTFVAMYEGLKLAFGDYSIAGAPVPPRAPARQAFEHYRGIERELGAPLPPPVSVLSQLVEDLLTEGAVESARVALAWLVDGYGAHPERAQLEAMIARVAAQPPLTETVASMRAAPRPTASELAPYLGEWLGEYSINENARWRGGLRLRLDGDTVVAQIIDYRGNVEGVMPVDYIRVVPGGIEFGRMNGMRPMGLVVSEARLVGDALEGRQRFRGIVMPLPDGSAPPEVRFRLVRR